MRQLEILAKWRQWFAGWQLGTRAKGDAEGDAVRDHREATLLLRAEVSALVGLLVAKNVITTEELTAALLEEAERLDRDLSERFPGVYATEIGMTYTLPAAAETMRKMNFRP